MMNEISTVKVMHLLEATSMVKLSHLCLSLHRLNSPLPLTVSTHLCLSSTVSTHGLTSRPLVSTDRRLVVWMLAYSLSPSSGSPLLSRRLGSPVATIWICLSLQLSPSRARQSPPWHRLCGLGLTDCAASPSSRSSSRLSR
ncbi:hypothetical protein Syun_026167 [Stephania yunnanensis]|uniref:Uncharacterized protein n=1 Tax=Stephania yunnanensis TaxID=152371 RepID=A0AAP0EYE7_9MAGN